MEAYDHEAVRPLPKDCAMINADYFARTFVGPDFTRRPVKYERFIRPMGLRYKKVRNTLSTKLNNRY
jgi:hypothetical protein